MDELFATIGKSVLTEAGLVSALLLAACVYLARQWSSERKEHKATTDKVFQMATEGIKASAATTEALNGLTKAVEKDQLIRFMKGGE